MQADVNGVGAGTYDPNRQAALNQELNAILHPGGAPTATGAEMGAFVMVGRAWVTCCDDKQNYRHMEFLKYGWGGVIGAGVGAGLIRGLDGEDCRHERYEGYFLEFGASAGPVGAFLDIGLGGPIYDPLNLLGTSPSTFSGVVEGGVGAGLSAKLKLLVFAWYVFQSEEVLPPGAPGNPCCRTTSTGTN